MDKQPSAAAMATALPIFEQVMEMQASGESDHATTVYVAEQLDAYAAERNASIINVLSEWAAAKRAFNAIIVKRGVFTHEHEMAARRFDGMDDKLLAIVDTLNSEVTHG